jgi:signal transduction histidine kinase
VDVKLLSSLTNRIFLATAALAVLCIGSAVYVISARVTRDAERDLARGLAEAATLVKGHHGTLSETFTLATRLTADQPKLKAAAATNHPLTVEPLAAEYRERVRSDLFVVTNREGGVLAAVANEEGGGDPAAIRDALAGRETVSFRAHSRGVMQVVTVPISIEQPTPEILGALSLGFVLDGELARRLGHVTESEIAFALDGRILAATLPAEGWPALAPLLSRSGVSEATLGDDDYVALSQSLSPAAARTAEGPAAVVLRSRTARLRLLRGIHFALAGTALLAILMAILLSYAVARTVTRPLAMITATMREMATTGDLTRKIELSPGHWEDEDARLLATTFNTLTDSIGHFQRDAAQRERLSALGRLSTVVAHEIRNPLMIIKASLRVLRDGSAPATDTREALADIDSEVARLNRVVNEVLDLARPIHVERAPTDLNAVCAGAAQAAMSAESEPRIVLHLDPGLPTVTTDGERFRTALVNILANARQAVTDRGAGGPPVELRTAVEGGRVAVVIQDRGTGIQARDLPNVFDPYFTTRRTGTGLGLAISKNIVEALGGAISVTSRPGEGTTVHIDLPGPADEAPSAPASAASF